MDYFKIIFSTLILGLISISIQAQNDESFSKMNLNGKWEAGCPKEVSKSGVAAICPICFVEVVNKTAGSGKVLIKDFEMTFTNTSLILNRDGSVTSIPYNKMSANSFSFALDKKQYVFNVTIFGNQRILEEKAGTVVILTKIN